MEGEKKDAAVLAPHFCSRVQPVQCLSLLLCPHFFFLPFFIHSSPLIAGQTDTRTRRKRERERKTYFDIDRRSLVFRLQPGQHEQQRLQPTFHPRRMTGNRQCKSTVEGEGAQSLLGAAERAMSRRRRFTCSLLPLPPTTQGFLLLLLCHRCC